MIGRFTGKAAFRRRSKTSDRHDQDQKPSRSHCVGRGRPAFRHRLYRGDSLAFCREDDGRSPHRDWARGPGFGRDPIAAFAARSIPTGRIRDYGGGERANAGAGTNARRACRQPVALELSVLGWAGRGARAAQQTGRGGAVFADGDKTGTKLRECELGVGQPDGAAGQVE